MGSGLLCLCAMLFCYYLSVTTFVNLIILVDTMTVRDSRIFSTVGVSSGHWWIAILYDNEFLFSWQFQIILLSKQRIDRIQKLLDAGRCVSYRGRPTVRK